MSLRPRYAGDGRLRLPATLTIRRTESDIWHAGDVMGEFGPASWDPFERTADGLLLAESFARLDLEQPRQAREWFLAHGVIDMERLFPEGLEITWDPGEERFQDNTGWVETQQGNVRWHLLSLARLSSERQRAGLPRPDRSPHEGWDPAWAQPAIEGPNQLIWLGGATEFESSITVWMRDHPRWEDAPPEERHHHPDPAVQRRVREEWWPAAHAAWLRVAREAVPILWVPWADWVEQWHRFDWVTEPPYRRLPSGPLYADWHGLVDLQRRLLAPYVQRAGANVVVLAQSDEGGLEDEDGLVGPIDVEERRVWTSVLAPIYLQLLEGLRRVSEGHSGAAWCKECGQPFLTLDARRSSFCNDRERFRYAQRERRRRQSTPLPWKGGQP
jgi:hypothetical protein